MRIFDTIDHVHLALDYHLARQNLLSANLAHIDTPGYRPLDLQRNESFQSQLAVALRATEPGHIGTPASGTGSGEAFRVFEDPGAAPGLDGNAVSIDREAVKMASNQLRYDTLAVIAQGELSGLSWAANDGRTG